MTDLARALHELADQLDTLEPDQVVKRTGMSKGWIYREARAGRLPFARKLGRRFTFDEAGLSKWLERRRAR